MNENETLATEMMRELQKNSKRWFVSFIVVLLLWFTTIGMFVWYVFQPTEEVIYTQEADTQGDNSDIDQNIGE